MPIKDRVVELIRVPAKDLQDHAGNWRSHPRAQREALHGLLSEVGIAGALLAYRSERNDGALTVIDGHLRKNEHPGTWPVIVVDLTDDEADKLLAFYDPIGAMATAVAERLVDLTNKVQTDDPALQAILDRQAAEAELAALMDDLAEQFAGLGGGASDPGPGGNLESQRAKVRPVIWIEDLATFEGAIRAVGNPNRGESLIAVCAFYLEHHDEGLGDDG